jgi:DNA-binding LytR/AlgR family response regulator
LPRVCPEHIQTWRRAWRRCHATISELEQKLDPSRFVRVHRSTLLNLTYIDEVNSWFAGGMVVRLKDGKRTELHVARDRVRELKARLDF